MVSKILCGLNLSLQKFMFKMVMKKRLELIWAFLYYQSSY